jgi:hypothetical protein
MEEWRHKVAAELRAASRVVDLKLILSATDALTSARPGARKNAIYEHSAQKIFDFCNEVKRLTERTGWSSGDLQPVQDAGLDTLGRRLLLSSKDVADTQNRWPDWLPKTLALELRRTRGMIRATCACHDKLLDLVKGQPPQVSVILNAAGVR